MESKNIKIKPMISEKSYNMANASNKYTFMVDLDANKIEISKYIESKYNVKVTNVNAITRLGKMIKEIGKQIRK
jgi:large subunit ribosomal protein L23